MSVRQAQEEISWREFAEWIAYDRLNPFGLERGDMQAGIVASAAVTPYLKPGAKISAADYMPDFLAEAKPAQDWRVGKAMMLQYSSRHNKNFKDKSNG